MTPSDLHELAQRAGIERVYEDAWGKRKTVSDSTLRALLQTLGYPSATEPDSTAPLHEPGLHAACDAPQDAQPERAWRPPALDGGGRRWGMAVQLYAVRSSRNWGIGDFTDLENLVRGAAALGAAAVGINPLHALFPERPDDASPYSPSSRMFANPLYLDIEAIADLELCPAVRAHIASPTFQEKIHAARASDVVAYREVAELKQPIVARIYSIFFDGRLSHDSARGRAFRAFQSERGEELRRFALFNALAATLKQNDWRAWPVEFRDPCSPRVAAFEREHGRAIQFHEYLQWQVSLQLATVNAAARDCGMSIGVYTDLAVGAAPSGAEVWSTQPLWMHDIAIGAPPDPLNLSGQNWGLPPLRPPALKNNACTHYRTLLDAAMREAGALRIDHILGLMRLWWIPQGNPATEGAYVRYPWQELLGVLAGASCRHHCLVVGEDLGTVPHGLRQAMHEAGILSCRLLYFSKQDGAFPAPDDFPPDALIAVGSHDLPPFGMWWRGDDIALRDALNLWPTQDLRHGEIDDRRQARSALLSTLRAHGLLQSDAPLKAPPIEAAHAYLARTPCKLLMVQLADVLDQRTQNNLPGTTDEYPNWRQKLPIPFEAALAGERMTRLAKMLRVAGRADARAT